MHMFGIQLERLRRINGVSQIDLAKSLNINTQQTISKWETSILPNMKIIRRIAEVFDVDYRLLFTNDFRFDDIVKDLYRIWISMDSRNLELAKKHVLDRNASKISNQIETFSIFCNKKLRENKLVNSDNDVLLHSLKKTETEYCIREEHYLASLCGDIIRSFILVDIFCNIFFDQIDECDDARVKGDMIEKFVYEASVPIRSALLDYAFDRYDKR